MGGNNLSSLHRAVRQVRHPVVDYSNEPAVSTLARGLVNDQNELILNLRGAKSLGDVLVPAPDASGLEIRVSKSSNATDNRANVSSAYTVPFATIGAAVEAKSAGDTIVVGPGTYDEQITLNGGDVIHFEAGAIVNYTGSGATFQCGETHGQVKVQGFGRFYKSGNATVQHVFDIAPNDEEDMWHWDINAEDVQLVIGHTSAGGHSHLVSEGEEFADEAARLADTPSHAGHYGFQRDTEQKYISTGNTAGAWAELTASAVNQRGGYIKIRSHSIEGIGGDAIRHENGSADFRAERIVGSGYGCAAYDDGFIDPAEEIIQDFNFVWLEAIRIESDRNEVSVRLHHSVNGGLYLTANTIFGGFRDLSLQGNANLFVGSNIWIPHYDANGEDGHTTLPYLIDIRSNGNTYFFDVQQWAVSGGGLFRLHSAVNGPRIYFKSFEAYQYNTGTPANPAISIQVNGGDTCSLDIEFIGSAAAKTIQVGLGLARLKGKILGAIPLDISFEAFAALDRVVLIPSGAESITGEGTALVYQAWSTAAVGGDVIQAVGTVTVDPAVL